MYIRKVFNKQNIETFIGVIPQSVIRLPLSLFCSKIVVSLR